MLLPTLQQQESHAGTRPLLFERGERMLNLFESQGLILWLENSLHSNFYVHFLSYNSDLRVGSCRMRVLKYFC